MRLCSETATQYKEDCRVRLHTGVEYTDPEQNNTEYHILTQCRVKQKTANKKANNRGSETLNVKHIETSNAITYASFLQIR